MGVGKRPKEWSGDLLAEHSDSERPSFFAWLAEWMDRWMKKLREGIAVIVRKILWPSHQC